MRFTFVSRGLDRVLPRGDMGFHLEVFNLMEELAVAIALVGRERLRSQAVASAHLPEHGLCCGPLSRPGSFRDLDSHDQSLALVHERVERS